MSPAESLWPSPERFGARHDPYRRKLDEPWRDVPLRPVAALI